MSISSDIKNDVATTLKRELEKIITNHEDNLAMQMQSEVGGYNPDWCESDGSSKVTNKHDELVEDAICQIVKAELEVLFANM